MLDLDEYTVLVLAFEQYDLVDQQDLDEPPVVRAFREACAALTPDLEVAFMQTRRVHDLLRHVADREFDVLTVDGEALLHQRFGLLYLAGKLDYGVEPRLTVAPRDELPITGGRLFFGGSGQHRWP
ncbi:hypothetical protein [Phytohabitans rumicis]|uniref:Uncharacterized protein n=1 Tax=Phytohabitans rumicis TaxID=1076125 RepID=A0A6V8L8E3_9ACTN|nr:hypothetical protein [Phytohabitans rumicis]GFJ91840.1 hypothetical protein Prum_054820 [Phytohabitans rumicis]